MKIPTIAMEVSRARRDAVRPPVHVDLLRRGAAAFGQGVSLKVTFRFETAGQ
jgi:hypothetical protein